MVPNQALTTPVPVHGNDDPLMTPGEVARLLRVDPVTLGRWARSGAIASVALPGGHRRYRRSVVAAILATAGTDAR
ncbi:helix-turn-helix domain-containing protein [Frankia sp. Cj3]|uniref:helix-turn-helix domain-containing protein n=1 Tax=Frankia sp. Cj3 TaxID=2880976 RepID=UPI001EF72C9D|nr:helix-turn-helix domain-containing protein [Frankia sp. Cj3]